MLSVECQRLQCFFKNARSSRCPHALSRLQIMIACKLNTVMTHHAKSWSYKATLTSKEA